MSEPSEFVIDADGYRRYAKDKLGTIFTGYLKPCGVSLMLRESPLEDALARNPGVTVIEAESTLTLASHLKTALVKRRNPDIRWDMITPDICMDRLIQGTSEAQTSLIEGWDPLVIKAFVWPRYLKASLFIGHICRTREVQGRRTFFALRSLKDLSTDPLMFDQDLRLWLKNECPMIKLTRSSLRSLALHPEQATAFLDANPGLDRPLRGVAQQPNAPGDDEAPVIKARTPAARRTSGEAPHKHRYGSGS